MTAGGRTTFGSAGALSFSALGGSCTGPITSIFLLTFVENSDSDGPASTYIVAFPPSALLSTYTVPPSVVFAWTTHPVSVDLGAACSLGACSVAGACAGAACSCANTPTALASVMAANVEVTYRMRDS